MSRPKPTVILENVDKETYNTDQIILTEGVWAVFYDGKPFSLKTSNLLTNYPGPKYKRSVFTSPGHAHNLAKKLNKQFKTDKFAVYLLSDGLKVFK